MRVQNETIAQMAALDDLNKAHARAQEQLSETRAAHAEAHKQLSQIQARLPLDEPTKESSDNA